MAYKWIQKALSQHHKGALHKELGVPLHEHIPIPLLEEIEKKPIGSHFYNHYKGKKEKVTHLLKERVTLALNLHKLRMHGGILEGLIREKY